MIWRQACGLPWKCIHIYIYGHPSKTVLACLSSQLGHWYVHNYDKIWPPDGLENMPDFWLVRSSMTHSWNVSAKLNGSGRVGERAGVSCFSVCRRYLPEPESLNILFSIRSDGIHREIRLFWTNLQRRGMTCMYSGVGTEVDGTRTTGCSDLSGAWTSREHGNWTSNIYNWRRVKLIPTSEISHFLL